MKHVLSNQQMRKAEGKVIGELGVSSLVLMETAGKACADYLVQSNLLRHESPVLILCGRGNNGGDGAVIARWLHQYQYAVILAIVGDGPISPDAQTNFEICQKLEVPTIDIQTVSDVQTLREHPLPAGLIIDAIFGTGFHGELSDFHRQLFQMFNDLQTKTIAIDIPSGVDGDTGFSNGSLFCHQTLVIGAYKYGNLLSLGNIGGKPHHLIDIGIPDAFIQELHPARLVDKESCIFPPRYRLAHKSNYGEVAIIAGSPGFAGCAILAAKSALRSGAGYVRLYAYPMLQDSYEGVYPEILCEVVQLNDYGKLDSRSMADLFVHPSAVLIGPGIGFFEYGISLVEFVLKQFDVPIVLDADALTILADKPSLLHKLKEKKVLLTPHMGEFSRLTKIPMEELIADPIRHLKDFVKKYKVPVLLKSNTSVYCDPNRVIFNISGNDGLATGGSGDVLGGIIASFLAQGMPIYAAAINASFLMGYTAERLAQNWHTAAITPMAIIDHLFEKGGEIDFEEKTWTL